MLKRFLFIIVMPLILWAVPNKPSNLQLTADTHSVDITWGDNSQDESGFKIFRDGQLISIVPPNVTNYKDIGLSAGTTYRYMIKATDDNIIYVDSTAGGDDEFYEDMSDGTQAYPFLTIQEAVHKARSGDTIYVKAGDYYENIKFNHSGTKDKPITLTGEKGAVIYGVQPINANWQKVGTYSYKTTDIPYEPFSMMVKIDGKLRHIPRLQWDWSDNKRNPSTTNEILNYPPEGSTPLYYLDETTVVTDEQKDKIYNDIKIGYWDGIEAVYSYDPNTKTTYIRFRNGDDPKKFQLYGVTGETNGFGDLHNNRFTKPINESAAIDIDNSSNIIIKGFKIYSAQNGILIHGKDASNNIIENNEILNGQRRVSIARLAHDNIVRDNILHTELINPNHRPKAWWDWWRAVKDGFITDKNEEKSRAVAEHIYEVYKHEIGAETFSPLDSCGVFVDTAGSENRIYKNEIYDLLGGVLGNYKGRSYVYDNYIHNISSVATGPATFTNPSYIYNNRFEDVHIAYRPQLNFNDHMEQYKQRGYFFNNIVKNPKDIGSTIDVFGPKEYAQPSEDQLPMIYIYHNTFIGSGRDNQGVFHHLGKNIYVINNIFLDNFINSDGGDFGLFAYNWSNILDKDNGIEDGNNGNVSGESLWDTDSIDLKNFNPSMVKVPSNSTAHEAGIDLSKEFTIEGKVYKPFPMLKSGYYKGSRPDIGVVY